MTPWWAPAAAAAAAAAAAVSSAQGLSDVVRAVTSVHGESDHIAGDANYEADLVECQADYQADVVVVTLQAELVPLLQTQMSSWTRYGQAESAIPSAQLSASRNNPDRIVLVGLKYTLAYAADGVHLTNEGYRHMGEYYAKVYRRQVLELDGLFGHEAEVLDHVAQLAHVARPVVLGERLEPPMAPPPEALPPAALPLLFAGSETRHASSVVMVVTPMFPVV